MKNYGQVQKSVEGNQCGVPENKVEHCSDLIEHALKLLIVACHGRRKAVLSTWPFWTHRNLYSKEDNTTPDSWEGKHELNMILFLWTI